MAEVDFRSRLMAFIVYGSERDIDLFLAYHSNRILHFAYICHDQDRHTDGSLKEPHYHLCVNLKTDYFVSDMVNKIKEITHQNVMGEVLLSKNRMYAYLTHSGSPDKYQYDKSLIISDSPTYWMNRDEAATKCVYDILAGADTAYLLKEYGNFYMLHLEKLEKLAQKLRRELKILSTPEVIKELQDNEKLESRASDPEE